MPWFFEARTLWYWKDMFDQAGVKPESITTWDSWLDALKKLTKGEVYGIAIRASKGWGQYWSSLAAANGGPMVDKDGKITVDTPQHLEALQWWTDLFKVHKVSGPGTPQHDQPAAQQLFLKRQVAMLWDNATVRRRDRRDPVRPHPRLRADLHPAVAWPPASCATLTGPGPVSARRKVAMSDARTMLSRRGLLAALGSLAATAALTACGAAPAPTPTTAPAPKPADKPAEKPAAAAPTNTPAAAAKPAEATKPAEKPAEKPAAAAPSTGAASAKFTFMSRGGDPLLKASQGLIAEYNKGFPGHEITIDHTSGDHFQKLQLGVAAGNPPDVYFDASLRTGGLAWHKKIIEDLEPYLKDAFKPDEHIKEMWIAMVYEGRRIGVPFDSGAMALYFNTDLFNKAGVPLPDPKKRMTWDELLQKAKQLTLDANGKHPGDAGFDPTRIQQYGFAPTQVHGHEHWIYTLGGEIIDKNGKVAIDSPEAIEGYQRIADFGAKDFVGPSPEYKQANPIGFASGNVAMQEDGVWNLGRTNDAKVNWGVAPFPMQKVPVSYGHYSGLSMTRMSKVKDAVWNFMNWTSLGHDGQTYLYKVGLLQPTRKELVQQFVDDKQPPAKEHRQVFVDELNSDTIRWAGQTQNSFYLGWRQYWIDAWGPRFDPVLRGKKQYKEIATETKQVLQKIVDTGEPATQ